MKMERWESKKTKRQPSISTIQGRQVGKVKYHQNRIHDKQQTTQRQNNKLNQKKNHTKTHHVLS